MNTHDLINDLEQQHHVFRKIILRCHLRSQTKYHRPGQVVTAEVTEVSPRNHVISIGDDRFGVYLGYYEELH